jgi:hypothetical protein
MPNLDTLNILFTNAATAAGSALSTAGRDLSGDVQNFVIPELRNLAEQIVLIKSRTGPDGLSDETAEHMIASDVTHAVNRITMVAAELLVTEVQNIINSALQAAAGVVNTAFGFKIF